MRNDRFLALDGLRGLCAVLVCLFHFRANNPLTEAAFIRGSWQFVDLFFVISGFVMAASYGHRLEDGLSSGRFALLRLARLYPLHLAVLFFYVAFEVLFAVVGLRGGRELFDSSHSPESIITNLLFLQSIGLHGGLTWNGPAWSIAVEFWACMLFALGIRLFGFRTWWLAAAVGVSVINLSFAAPDGIASTHDLGIFRCIYGFGLGAICWRLRQHTLNLIVIERWAWTFCEAALVVAVIAFVIAGGGLAAPVIFAVVVLVFAAGKGAISDVLISRPLLLLGTISYSIYMIHGLVQARFDDVLRSMGYDASIVVGGVDMLGRSTWEGLLLTQLMLAMVLIVSFICYALIEMPGQAWANRKIKRFAGYRQSAEVTIVEPPAPVLLDVKMIAPEPNAPER